MKLFSYVVARDYGFAPNPFFVYCTLATCKPNIRKVAAINDWIIGTGSRSRNREGRLVYSMRVTEATTFNGYWSDSRFAQKKPDLAHGSLKYAYGDNIYLSESGEWSQLNSHHSFEGGEPNMDNIARDTKADRVLISDDFSYWGGMGPEIDRRFRNYDGYDICAIRNHKCRFPDCFVNDFIAWIQPFNGKGIMGRPLDWPSRSHD